MTQARCAAITATPALTSIFGDPMEHAIKHGLTHEQAKAAVRSAIATYSEKLAKYSPQIAWQGDTKATFSFKAKGVQLEGGLTIEPDRFVVDFDIPFLLRPFKSKAIEKVESEAQTWIAKAKAGQL
jgi:hypothetical protein